MEFFIHQLLSYVHDFQDALESCLHGLGKQTSFLRVTIFVKKVCFFGTVFVCKNKILLFCYHENNHCMVYYFWGGEGVVIFYD